ncbi:hypothetical protein ACNKHM_15530 [Shigella sonnei]
MLDEAGMKGFPHVDHPDAAQWKHLHLFMRYPVLKRNGLPFRMLQHKVA